MARRVQANLEGGSDNNNTHFGSDNFHNNSYGYQSEQTQTYSQQNYDYSQENYDYQAAYGFQAHPNGVNPGSTSHSTGSDYSYGPNSANDYSYNSHTATFSSGHPNSNNFHASPVSTTQANFPSVNHSPLLQQSTQSPNYGSHKSYVSANYEHSWISAFSSGGFENEPPLMEELGINFSHIKDKTLASLNPFRKLDSGTLNDADLTGPLLFCFLFGTSLLLTGKVHFGYIYGVATLGWVSIFTILNLMTEKGVSFYLTASVLGYCLLPMVLLSAVAVLLKLRGIIGLVLGITSVSWCTFSSSTYFVAAFGMQHQQILIAYPIFLLYSCFALMTIF